MPIRMKQGMSTSSLQRKAKLLDKQYFLIPCNVGNLHWILFLVVWSETKPMVWVVDSMNTGEGQSSSTTFGVNKFLSAIDQVFEERYEHERGHPREDTKWEAAFASFQGQPRFWEFGYYVCYLHTCCCMLSPTLTPGAGCRTLVMRKCPESAMYDW